MGKTVNDYQITIGSIVSWGNSNQNAQLNNIIKLAIVQINSSSKNENISTSCPFDCSNDCNKDSCTFECGSDCHRDCGKDD